MHCRRLMAECQGPLQFRRIATMIEANGCQTLLESCSRHINCSTNHRSTFGICQAFPGTAVTHKAVRGFQLTRSWHGASALGSSMRMSSEKHHTLYEEFRISSVVNETSHDVEASHISA
jgi:hypothetical protein